MRGMAIGGWFRLDDAGLKRSLGEVHTALSGAH